MEIVLLSLKTGALTFSWKFYMNILSLEKEMTSAITIISKTVSY